MQFRPAGKRVQVLAYRGYDKVKKRAQVKLLGSFDRYSYDLSDGLADSLTDDEKAELQSHIEKMRQSFDSTVRQFNMRYLASHIRKVCDSLMDEQCASSITQEYASEVYQSIDSLTKALRKLGHVRPAKRTE